MNKFFKKYVQKIAYIGGIVISSLVVGISLQLVHAWSEPSLAPPAGNLGAPISTGAATQIKTGALYVNGGTITPILYDTDNTGYYVDPASTSRLNYGVYDNLYSYGWLQSPIFYDANNTNYYVDPASTSVLNTLCLSGDCRNAWPGSGSAVYLGVIGGWAHCQGHLFPSFAVCNSACPGGCYYAGHLSP